MKLGLVTDSTSDIDFQWAKENNIKVAPLNVHFNDEHHIEDENFDFDAYYQNFEDQDLFKVKTSQPSPSEFIDRYEELVEDGCDFILSIVISSGLSGTYNSATLAAQEVMGNHDVKIEAIDSRLASMGIVFLVEKAMELGEQGVSPQEIIEKVREHRKNISIILSLPTLKYLRASGRISFPKFLIGRIFGLKPITKVNEKGENEAVGTVRNLEKGNRKIVDMTLDAMDGEPQQIAIVHSNSPERAEKIEKILRESLSEIPLRKIRTGSSISAHTGPGAIALIAEF